MQTISNSLSWKYSTADMDALPPASLRFAQVRADSASFAPLDTVHVARPGRMISLGSDLPLAQPSQNNLAQPIKSRRNTGYSHGHVASAPRLTTPTTGNEAFLGGLLDFPPKFQLPLLGDNRFMQASIPMPRDNIVLPETLAMRPGFADVGDRNQGKEGVGYFENVWPVAVLTGINAGFSAGHVAQFYVDGKDVASKADSLIGKPDNATTLHFGAQLNREQLLKQVSVNKTNFNRAAWYAGFRTVGRIGWVGYNSGGDISRMISEGVAALGSVGGSIAGYSGLSLNETLNKKGWYSSVYSSLGSYGTSFAGAYMGYVGTRLVMNQVSGKDESFGETLASGVMPAVIHGSGGIASTGSMAMQYIEAGSQRDAILTRASQHYDLSLDDLRTKPRSELTSLLAGMPDGGGLGILSKFPRNFTNLNRVTRTAALLGGVGMTGFGGYKIYNSLAGASNKPDELSRMNAYVDLGSSVAFGGWIAYTNGFVSSISKKHGLTIGEYLGGRNFLRGLAIFAGLETLGRTATWAWDNYFRDRSSESVG